MRVLSIGALILGWLFAAVLVLCTVLMFVSGPTGELWLLGTIAAEQALVITALAVTLAVLLRRHVGLVVIGAVVVVASLVPTVAATRAAGGIDWGRTWAGRR
ncbi:MAG: hypothetical protein ACRDTA_27495 [Pseudonocardiaceae bacterium]